MSRRTPSPPQDLAAPDGEATIDVILDGLEAAVRDLEGGELRLEQALERFERGVELARRGSTLLDRVEERIEMLLADRDATVPLDDDRSGDEEARP